jgi:hypothetical protein
LPIINWSLFLNGFNAGSSSQQQHIGWARGKQTIGHNANDLVDFGFHGNRVADAQTVHIDNYVAIIRGEITQSRLAA